MEWDEEAWLDTLPAKLNHKIMLLGGARRALTGLTNRDKMMIVFGSKRGEELEKAFGLVRSCTARVNTQCFEHATVRSRLSKNGESAIVCRSLKVQGGRACLDSYTSDESLKLPQIVPRSLEVNLLRAKALPACDSNGLRSGRQVQETELSCMSLFAHPILFVS
jgi:hypothetical protein